MPEAILATSAHVLRVGDRDDRRGSRGDGATSGPSGATGNNLGRGVLRGSGTSWTSGGSIMASSAGGGGTLGAAAMFTMAGSASLAAGRGSGGRGARESYTCSHSSWLNRQRGIISVIQKGECVGILGGGRHLRERKHCLIECNVMRDDDPVRVEVETSISLMIGGILEENTQAGAR